MHTRTWQVVAVAVLGLAGAATWSLLHRTPGHAPLRNARETDRRERRQGAQREKTGSPNEQAFWNWRVSYPTGRFASSWYADAVPQHERLPKGMPQTPQAKLLARGVLDPAHVTALGPAPLDWSSDYGLVAGRVNAIVVHPTQPNIAWFGADGGGVWKTSNCCGADTTWHSTIDKMPDGQQIANIAIGALVLDPHDANTLYAGTGDTQRNRPFAFGASGLLKSNDGGESWRVLGTDVFNPVYTQAAGDFPQRRSISAIAVDPNASRNVVVGTNQGMYFSHDGGTSWNGPCFSNEYATQRQDVTGLLAVGNGTSTDVLVAIGSLVSSSTLREDQGDNGANGIYRASMPAAGCPVSWSVLSRSDNGWPAGSASGVANRAGGNPLARIDLAVAPGNARILYAQVMYLGVWRSDDGGATWAQTAQQPQDFDSGCAQDSHDNGIGFEDYNAGITVSGSDPNIVFLSSIDLWRSTDGGHHFVDLTCAYGQLASGAPGSVHPDNHARAFAGARQLLIGNDGGIYSSADALADTPQFVAANSGVNTIEFYSGDITAGFDGPATVSRGIVGGAQDNGSATHVWYAGTKPGIAQWKEAFGGDGIFAKIEPMLEQRWYYSAQYGYIVASVSGPDGPVEKLVTPEDPQSFVDWQGDRTGFLTPFDLYKFGDARSCPPASGCQRMLVGTYRVWESLSGGLPSTSWYINSPDLTKTLSDDNNLSIINRVTFAHADPSVALVATNDGNAWFGFDLGGGVAKPANWVNVTANNAVLPNRPIMDMRSAPWSATTAYASIAGFDQNTPATPGHVFQLDCSARCATFTWRNKSGNLPNIPVNAILINPNIPTQAFAGTDWGLYFTDRIDVDVPVWQRFDAQLPSAMIWDLVIDRGATTLAIFTRSRGAYVWPLPRGATPLNPIHQVRPPRNEIAPDREANHRY